MASPSLPDPGMGGNSPRHLSQNLSLSTWFAIIVCAVLMALWIYFELSVNCLWHQSLEPAEHGGLIVRVEAG